MIFEVGKFYEHTNGYQLSIVGVAKTTMFGHTLIAEQNNSIDFQAVGSDEASAANYKEITEEEWMKNFDSYDAILNELRESLGISQVVVPEEIDYLDTDTAEIDRHKQENKQFLNEYYGRNAIQKEKQNKYEEPELHELKDCNWGLGGDLELVEINMGKLRESLTNDRTPVIAIPHIEAGLIPIEDAWKVLARELQKDQALGSYYYSWQSNIAMTIMDNSNISHEKANAIAKKFLSKLVS